MDKNECVAYVRAVEVPIAPARIANLEQKSITGRQTQNYGIFSLLQQKEDTDISNC